MPHRSPPNPSPQRPEARPNKPVGAPLVEDAIWIVEEEERHRKRRTGRRLALIAIGVATLLTGVVCGTGGVVSAQRQQERDLWTEFAMLQAEHDCCTGTSLPAPCQAAPKLLEQQVVLARARPSTAERFAESLEGVLGFSPVLMEVSLPDLTEVEATLSRCRALAGEVAEVDCVDVVRLAQAGPMLCEIDTERDLIHRALGAQELRVVSAALHALFDAKQRVQQDLRSAALFPTSGGHMQPGAESSLHSRVRCHQLLAPLVETARAAARTHEAALVARVTANKGEEGPGSERRTALWALTLVDAPAVATTAALAAGLVRLPAVDPGAHEPFLEQAVGLALARTPSSSGMMTAPLSPTSNVGVSPTAHDPFGDTMDPALLRLARALTRVGSLRADACMHLADAVVDEAKRIRQHGWRDTRIVDGVPPVCDVAAAHLVGFLPLDPPKDAVIGPEDIPPQQRGWADAQLVSALPAFGLTGLQEAQKWLKRHETLPVLAHGELQSAMRKTVAALYVSKAGVSPLVAGHPEAMAGLRRPQVTTGSCPGALDYDCVTAVVATDDSLLLLDVAR